MVKKILPPTTKRVSYHSSPLLNSQIRNQTLAFLKTYQSADKNILDNVLKKLDEEWDTERVLEANAAAAVVISSILGLSTSKCWFFVSGTIGCFLLQHALQGWCPPVPVIRKLGVRTAEEISHQRIALKLLRGDFQHAFEDPSDLLAIAEI